MLCEAERKGWELVYCDMLRNDDSIDGRKITGAQGDYYFKWDVAPHVGGIDKTGFLVRRDRFTGFPKKNTDVPGPCAADGELVAALVKCGVRHGKAAGILVVHN